MQGDCKTPTTRLHVHRHAKAQPSACRVQASCTCHPESSPPGPGVGVEGDCDAASRTAAKTRQRQRRRGRQGRGGVWPRDDSDRCETEALSKTAQAATRTGHVTSTRYHHYLKGGAMRRIRIMLLLASTGAAVLVGMFVHR